MGVHDAPPLLFKKEKDNPLQAGGVYGMDVMTLLYAIIACVNVMTLFDHIFLFWTDCVCMLIVLG